MMDNWYNQYPEKIIAFDPGGTTGVAYYSVDSYDDKPDRFYLGPNKEHHHEQIEANLDTIEPHVVVTERFDYRRNQKHADLISVEYIGVLRLWCRKNGVDLVEQKQLKGHKGLWTNEKLKVMGLYKPGENWEHAMDATRQLFYYMTEVLKDDRWITLYSRAMGVEPE